MMRRVVRRHGGVVRRTPAILVAASAVAILACRSSTRVASPLDGAWLGDLPSQTVLSLHLAVSDSSVSGNGAIGSLTGTTTVALTVTGWFEPPDVRLSLVGSLGAIAFVGSLSGASLPGSLNGGGYVNTAVTLSKR
jgi:hypothetical protein